MKKLGRNQKIALFAMAAPFVVATTALFMGKAEFSEWSSHVSVLIPIALGTVLGLGAAVKIAGSKGRAAE